MQNKKSFQGWMLNLINDSIKENRDYYYKLSEQADKIVVWLVGFSVASLALVFKGHQEGDLILTNLSTYVLIFGGLTIVLGILYRVFLFISQTIECHVIMTFEGYIEGFNNLSNFNIGRHINEDDTYEDIINFIYVDFGVTIEKENTTMMDYKEIVVLRKSVVEYYHSLNSWSNRMLEKEISEVKSVMKHYFGFSQKGLDKLFNIDESDTPPTTIYKFFFYTSGVLFIGCCLAFIVGITIIVCDQLICL